MAGHIRDAINAWFKGLVDAALNPVLRLLGRTILATPGMGSQGRIHDLWTNTLMVTDGLYGVIIMIGGIIVMTHETIQTRYALRDIAPRLVIGFIVANASLSLIDLASTVTNAVAVGLLGQGADATGAASLFFATIVNNAATGSIFITFLLLVLVVMAVTLLLSYIIRICLMVLLTVAAPLALAAYALPFTEGLAVKWWRALGACYAIQLGQALVFITGVRVFFSTNGFAVFGLGTGDGLVSVLVCLALLYILIRIPSWAVRSVFSGGRGLTVTRLLKYRIASRLLSRGLGALGIPL